MSAREEIGTMSPEKIKDYAISTGKIAAAVESMLRQDGWQIFMALYNRTKNEIKEKNDYASLEDFKADRKALDIVEGVLDVFKGYISDASDAATLLAGLSPEESPTDRGIMLIEQAEGGTVEG